MKTRQQQGVVLIMTLVMLVIVSLMAVSSMKTAVSGEVVSGSVRANQLAHQAAEAALRYCERAVDPGTATYTLPSVQAVQATARWQDVSATWDAGSAPGYVFPVPLSVVNTTTTAALTLFKRSPECVVEALDATGNAYVVTARGFGPEVEAPGASSRRPEGSEVFLQSTIEK